MPNEKDRGKRGIAFLYSIVTKNKASLLATVRRSCQGDEVIPQLQKLLQEEEGGVKKGMRRKYDAIVFACSRSPVVKTMEDCEREIQQLKDEKEYRELEFQAHGHDTGKGDLLQDILDDREAYKVAFRAKTAENQDLREENEWKNAECEFYRQSFLRSSHRERELEKKLACKTRSKAKESTARNLSQKRAKASGGNASKKPRGGEHE